MAHMVRLNVGGQRFEVGRSTLSRVGGYLATLIEAAEAVTSLPGSGYAYYISYYVLGILIVFKSSFGLHAKRIDCYFSNMFIRLFVSVKYGRGEPHPVREGRFFNLF